MTGWEKEVESIENAVREDISGKLPGKNFLRNFIFVLLLFTVIAAQGIYLYEQSQTISRVRNISGEQRSSVYTLKTNISLLELELAGTKERLLAYKYRADRMALSGEEGFMLLDFTDKLPLAGGLAGKQKDSDNDGIADDIDAHPRGGEVNLPRTVRFLHNRKWHNVTLLVNYDWYYYYAQRPRAMAKEQYITSRNPIIMNLSRQLLGIAIENDYMSYSELVGSFVQSIPYVEDNASKGYPYPRYPVETLEDWQADCEDKTYLAVSILMNLGIDTVLIDIPSHIVPGVACANCNGTFVMYAGRKYFYLETTAYGWKLGEVPEEYKSKVGPSAIVRGVSRQ